MAVFEVHTLILCLDTIEYKMNIQCGKGYNEQYKGTASITGANNHQVVDYRAVPLRTSFYVLQFYLYCGSSHFLYFSLYFKHMCTHSDRLQWVIEDTHVIWKWFLFGSFLCNVHLQSGHYK